MASSRARAPGRRDISPASTSGWPPAAWSARIAAGLIAPYVFDWVAEYPILLALTLLCRPGLALPSERGWRILLFGGLAAAALILIVTTLNSVVLSETVFNRTFGALLISSVLFWRAPLPLAAMIAFVLLANHNIVEQAGAMSVRSFFGVTKVSETPDGQFRLLQHGTTLHGGQRIREFNGTEPAEPPELLMYYWDGPPSRRPSTRCARASTARSALR